MSTLTGKKFVKPYVIKNIIGSMIQIKF